MLQQGELDPVWLVSYKRRRRHTQRRSRKCQVKTGRGWSDAPARLPQTAAREAAWTDSPAETPKGTNPADTRIPDFQPPKLGTNNPLGLWHFLTAILGNWQTDRCCPWRSASNSAERQQRPWQDRQKGSCADTWLSRLKSLEVSPSSEIVVQIP